MVKREVIYPVNSSQFPISDHFDGRKFFNQDRSANVGKGLAEVLKWQLGAKRAKWPKQVLDNATPGLRDNLGVDEVAITHVNHATELIQFANFNVLTDPVFSERVSPFRWAGPRRHRRPGLKISELPRIDLILLSHNHYDHLNLDSIVEIVSLYHPKLVVPLGNKKYLSKIGIENVAEIDWWEQVIIAGKAVTLVPMQHWSARGLGDRFDALWGGFVIESNRLKVLFSGDSAYNQHYKAIAQKFGPMDVSILPIGAYAPRWFMKAQHMDPREAVCAHVDLQSKLSLGNHFGTFQLTDEGIDEPKHELAKSLATANVSPTSFLPLENGQTVVASKSRSE